MRKIIVILICILLAGNVTYSQRFFTKIAKAQARIDSITASQTYGEIKLPSPPTKMHSGGILLNKSSFSLLERIETKFFNSSYLTISETNARKLYACGYISCT